MLQKIICLRERQEEMNRLVEVLLNAKLTMHLTQVIYKSVFSFLKER